MRNLPTFLCAALFSALVLDKVCLAKDRDRQQGHGRPVRSQVGTLYDLRSKLSSRSSSQSAYSGSSDAKSAHPRHEKEARGYSFHYNPSDISNPVFPRSYSSQDFHSRMGKVNVDVPKKKHSEKNWDKLSKYAYKTSVNGEELPLMNSFTVFQNETSYKSASNKKETSVTQSTTVPTTPGPPQFTKSNKTMKKTTTMTTSTTSTTPLPSSGFDLSKIAKIGLGINDAMTSVLTQKLMGMIDQDFPQGIFNPLKHLVSSGNKMVEFWDKRANARDGKPPGIVEMMGYGIEQLKKYRDGQSMRASDPIANITSPSKTLIQGMLTVKKLTNRVLGYDTDENAVESRGGYGHDSGYGHHASYGGMGGLDPFALLAALAFGAFLLQLLLTLLNTSARSLDVVDLNTPLVLSDFHVPSFMTKMDKIFGTPTTRSKRSADDESEMFNSVIDKLDGMYKTYRVVSSKPSCARLYLCRLAVQDADSDSGENSYTSKLYMYGLKHLAGDVETNDFVKSIQSRVSKGEEVDCFKEVGDSCRPSDEEK